MSLRVSRNKVIKSTIIIRKEVILPKIALNLQKTSVDLDNFHTGN